MFVAFPRTARSLPTRERGLKVAMAKEYALNLKSLPTRERGLKDYTLVVLVHGIMSLPTRERGLKEFNIPNSHSIGSRSLHGSVD